MLSTKIMNELESMLETLESIDANPSLIYDVQRIIDDENSTDADADKILDAAYAAYDEYQGMYAETLIDELNHKHVTIPAAEVLLSILKKE